MKSVGASLKFRFAGLCTLLLATAAVLVPAAASAAPPTNVNVAFGLPPSASTNAGDETEYTITFTTSDAIDDSAGSVIVVNAAGMGLANGTIFPANAPATSGGAFYSVGVNGGQNNVVIAGVVRSNGNQTVAIPTFGTGVSAQPGDSVTVTIGYISETKVQNPSTTCAACRLAVATLSPGEAALPGEFNVSAPYAVNQGPGDVSATDGTPQATAVGTPFAAPLEATVVDGLGAPVQGETVTFTAPDPDSDLMEPGDEDPSGTFAGGTNGGLTFDAMTDANGVATSSVLTANGIPGSWSATASVATPGVASAQFNLVNQVGDATSITLTLTPDEIEANAVDFTTAKAVVTDAFGNRVSNEDVDFSSFGPQQISNQQELGNGVYRARVTSTTQPGNFTIVATDTTPNPNISDTDSLTQTADNRAPRTKIINKPRKSSTARRATFTFDSNAADTVAFQCRIDRRNFRPCSSPKAYQVRRGRHRFQVRARDTSGNVGPAATYRFRRTAN